MKKKTAARLNKKCFHLKKNPTAAVVRPSGLKGKKKKKGSIIGVKVKLSEAIGGVHCPWHDAPATERNKRGSSCLPAAPWVVHSYALHCQSRTHAFKQAFHDDWRRSNPTRGLSLFTVAAGQLSRGEAVHFKLDGHSVASLFLESLQ